MQRKSHCIECDEWLRKKFAGVLFSPGEYVCVGSPAAREDMEPWILLIFPPFGIRTSFAPAVGPAGTTAGALVFFRFLFVFLGGGGKM